MTPIDDKVVRTFICIDLPASVKTRIETLQRALRQIDAQVSWVKPANLHLTLKFLGDVASEQLSIVSDAVRRATSTCRPFPVTVSGTGCFPSPRNPRVLWVGIEPVSQALHTLHDCIETELSREGFAREAKRFQPHLTIARIRHPRNAQRLGEELGAQNFAPETFVADAVMVMGSELTPQGSIYTPQAVIPLPG